MTHFTFQSCYFHPIMVAIILKKKTSKKIGNQYVNVRTKKYKKEKERLKKSIASDYLSKLRRNLQFRIQDLEFEISNSKS